MPRHPEPRFYPSRQGWFVCVRGKQILLARGKDARAEAWAKWHRLMAEGVDPARPAVGVTVEVLADLFLGATEGKVAPLTYEFYGRHLRSFAREYGKAKAADVRPLHVERWLKAHRWADGTKHGAVTAVKRLYSWAFKQGHLDANPLLWVEKPGVPRRETVLGGDQIRTVLDAIPETGRGFRELLLGLFGTGARPSELARMEASMVDLERGLVVMPSKTTRVTGKPRLIPLAPAVIGLFRELAGRHPSGPLFRNALGNAWTRHAMALAFRRVRARTGLGRMATAVALRHGFATDGLEAGVSTAAMAAILGHESTKMLEAHYSHLHERVEHLKAAADLVRPRGRASEGTGEPGPGPTPA